MPMTLIEVMAVYAVVECSDGRARTKGTATDSQTAATGVLVRALSFRHVRENGRAPSREKANTIRLAEARPAFAQNNCATMTTRSRTLAAFVPRASRKICAGGTPVALPTVP